MKTFNILSRVILLFVFLVAVSACTTEDLEPSTEQNKAVEGGIESDANLYGILKGMYSRLTGSGYWGRDIIINNEVRTDNCFSNGNSGRFTTQASFTYNSNTGYFWDDAYRAIANANIIIGVNPDDLSGDKEYIKHMQGQAYVVRALVHFDLVKQYGQQHVGGNLGVPYVTEFKGDDLTPARNTVDEVKSMIMSDLNTGFGMMDQSYDISAEFISKYAAKAIESSVAVYFGMWSEAKAAAEAVINSGDYTIIPADAFVASFASDMSVNSIFELAFNSSDNRGINGLAYIYRTESETGGYGDVQVIDEVADLYEDGDVREGILAVQFGALRNVGKYPNNQGYDNVGVIRYEEVILNYAEALFETGGDALTELNKLVVKRGLAPYTEVSKDIIIDERRKELIFEGKRYDDMLRTGMDIEKFSLQQNITETIPYGDERLAFPIPQAEIDANSNVIQNDGY